MIAPALVGGAASLTNRSAPKRTPDCCLFGKSMDGRLGRYARTHTSARPRQEHVHIHTRCQLG